MTGPASSKVWSDAPPSVSVFFQVRVDQRKVRAARRVQGDEGFENFTGPLRTHRSLDP
jgi:hypothetical protein